MWALIVLILGSNPPEGTIKYGFKSEAECQAEAKTFCPFGQKEPPFRCKCERLILDTLPVPPLSPPKKGK
jgi:hypothetical protein